VEPLDETMQRAGGRHPGPAPAVEHAFPSGAAATHTPVAAGSVVLHVPLVLQAAYCESFESQGPRAGETVMRSQCLDLLLQTRPSSKSHPGPFTKVGSHDPPMSGVDGSHLPAIPFAAKAPMQDRWAPQGAAAPQAAPTTP